VEIRRAKNAEESTTLQAAKQSDVVAIGLAAAGFICCAGWFVTPKDIKEKITPIALAGFGGVGFVFKMKLVQIKDGRVAIGDLNQAITNYALLKPGDEDRLAEVGDFVAGRRPIAEMPIVKEAINAGVGQKVNAHIAELERFAAAREALAKSEPPTSQIVKQLPSQVPLQPIDIKANSRILPEEVI